jgi:hypothetical protein
MKFFLACLAMAAALALVWGLIWAIEQREIKRFYRGYAPDEDEIKDNAMRNNGILRRIKDVNDSH